MKKLQMTIFAVSLILSAFISTSFADTFTHPKTRETLHGYATSQTGGGKTTVHTQEKGPVDLNLAEWDIIADRTGRNNKVIILTLDEKIMLEIVTKAMEQAIVEASDEGPLFILLEIDTPGGRTDFAQRICGAITSAGNCPVIAFMKGGKHGGAISAGAAVAFACDKIYMTDNTIIGAATLMVTSLTGPKDLKKVFGEDYGEKIDSVWRAYLASLAEQNRRPGLLAKAMVDKDIEVIEVSEQDKTAFIEPVNKKPKQRIVHTWSKRGSLLTLTATEAIKCKIADKIVGSRDLLLRDLEAAGAEIVINDAVQKARKIFEMAKRKAEKIRKSLDLKFKQMQQTQDETKALKLLRQIRGNFKSVIILSKRYPDLELSVPVLEDYLNSVEAVYQEAKNQRRKSRRSR